MITIEQIPEELRKAEEALNISKNILTDYRDAELTGTIRLFVEDISRWIDVAVADVETLVQKRIDENQAAYDKLLDLQTLLNNTLQEALSK